MKRNYDVVYEKICEADLVEIFGENIAISRESGEILLCKNTLCGDCKFGDRYAPERPCLKSSVRNWLMEDVEEDGEESEVEE